MCADHHSRSSTYYKDSYGSSSKRYHSPSDSSRLGLSGSSSLSHYYDTSDGRSKRSRGESYGNGTGAHTSSTSRYNDYSPSGSSNSRYKAASPYYDSSGLKSSSSEYRREDSYGRAGVASSSSKYLSSIDDSYGKLQGISRSSTKSVVRRIPPPLTPPISSSSSKSLMKSAISASTSSSSSNRLLPLMKVSVASNSGVGGGSGSAGVSKDYYGSRMRQAPPEHHHYTHSGSSTYKKEFRRPNSFSSGRYVSGGSFNRPGGYGSFAGGGGSHGRNLAAIRKLTQRTAASVTNRIQRRATTAGISRGYEDDRRRHVDRRKYTSKKDTGDKEKESDIDKSKSNDKDEDGSSGEKEKADEESSGMDVGDDGNEVIDEVRGDDDTETEDKDAKTEEDVSLSVEGKEDEKDGGKDESWDAEDNIEKDESEDTTKSPTGTIAKESDKKTEKNKTATKEKDKIERRRSTRDGSPSSRTLLKLHCHYCDVRCISFREFSNHLRSYVHTRAMHSAVTDMRKKLSNLRNDQRDDQRKLEKSKSEKTLSDTTSYCRVCELNFRTDPKEHEANELHNKIKTLIYQRCDICNIDFRIWKVYLYHLAALEHAKRVAMKELQEGEAKGENVKGTNLSQEELGLDLVEQRTVFYCNACSRYLPIKGTLDETKGKHCMTLTHLKYVDDFRQREKQIALREKEREKAAAKKALEDADAADGTTADNADSAETPSDTIGGEDKDNDGDQSKVSKDGTENDNGERKIEGMDNDHKDTLKNMKIEVDDSAIEDDESALKTHEKIGMDNEPEDVSDKMTSEGQVEEKANAEIPDNDSGEEEDEDEIELHAGDEVEEDLSMDDSGWSRRTRSSIRKNSSDRKSTS